MQLVIYHYYSFDTLKRAFVGVHKVIQANDKSECEQVIIIVRHNIHNPSLYQKLGET